jgi:hypothetical protein
VRLVGQRDDDQIDLVVGAQCGQVVVLPGDRAPLLGQRRGPAEVAGVVGHEFGAAHVLEGVGVGVADEPGAEQTNTDHVSSWRARKDELARIITIWSTSGLLKR